jgi:hypothetical protein
MARRISNKQKALLENMGFNTRKTEGKQKRIQDKEYKSSRKKKRYYNV